MLDDRESQEIKIYSLTNLLYGCGWVGFAYLVCVVLTCVAKVTILCVVMWYGMTVTKRMNTTRWCSLRKIRTIYPECFSRKDYNMIF